MLNFKKLSIIIVNYQSEQYLQKCLASLFRFNLGIDFEIVIINNDKKEKLDKIKEEFSSIVLINSPKNSGFGAACNLGVKISQGDLLFFLNPDTEILNSFGPIINEFEQNLETGALGPKLLGENGKVQEWSTGVEVSLGDLIRNNLGLPRSRKIWESLVVKETYWISGAALFIPRTVFFEIGGFDENFFMYFEDNDLCRRIRKSGKKLFYFPKVTIRHLGGKSSQDLRKQKAIFFASQDYYFKKHFGLISVYTIKTLRSIALFFNNF
jgi:GT2 family glycosyltransferase